MPVSSTQRSQLTPSAGMPALGAERLPAAGLRHGMKGAEVRQLQAALVRLGFMTAEQVATGPGTFGPRTRAAVETLQAALGAKVTGSFTAETREKLAAKLSPPAVGEPRPRPPSTAANTGSNPPLRNTDQFVGPTRGGGATGQVVPPVRNGVDSQGLPAGAELPLGNMNWGVDPSGKPWTPQTLAAAMQTQAGLAAWYQKAFKNAEQALGQEFPVLERFDSEGRLKGDPRKERTAAARKTFDPLFALALTARFGPPELAAKAQARALPVLMGWVNTYKPSGNPINETDFPKLFRSLELMRPFMTEAQVKQTRGWLREFIDVHDRVELQGLCKVNNWYDWRLAIQGAAAKALGNDKLLARVRKDLNAQVAHSVRNDGSSFDFHHRDALHYHLYTLRAWTTLASVAPDAFTPKARAEVLKSIEFLRPYYEGRKTHIEFANTQVAFDKARARNGEETYVPHPWDPKEANSLLQQARAVFPEIRDWTAGAMERNEGLAGELMVAQLLLN
ncbi:MAG: alginate lyase family protein [Deltaproteobacteria bacterium]|nr:alginate lyase family protein [Deltaproteobacteria bacterium]